MFDKVLLVIRSIARLLTPYPTYFVDIGVVAGGAGYAAEIQAANRKSVRIKSVWFSKPSAAVTLRLIKASTASDGGTSTAGTAVAAKGDGGPDGRIRLFTGAPTAGTAIGDVFEMAVGTGDNVEIVFGDNGTEPLEINGTQAFAVNVSAAATIVGRIVYEEVEA